MAKPSEVPVKVTPSAPARHPVRSLREQMDRLFDDLGDWFPWRSGELSSARRTGSGGAFAFGAPAVEVSERDDAFELCAELPGVDPKEVEVTVEDDVLILRGEKKEEREEKKKDYHYTERSYGAFQRAFTLPPQVQADQIKATFKNGVLTVTLPKSPEAKARQRRITIES